MRPSIGPRRAPSVASVRTNSNRGPSGSVDSSVARAVDLEFPPGTPSTPIQGQPFVLHYRTTPERIRFSPSSPFYFRARTLVAGLGTDL